MGNGFIISMIVMFILIILILAIMIPYDRKYIVRENGKINYKKTNVYLRWNTFDTLTIILAIYTIICVQVLNFLIMRGETIDNPYIQFFTNQSQAWVIVIILYLITRIQTILKSVQAHFGDIYDKNK